ncbi:MAG: hypothetical protein F9K18_13625, partial [Thermoanaerobaculia bacterium]
METDSGDGLGDRLRDANEEELGALIRDRLPEIDARAARQAFRNPFLSGPQIETLAASPALSAAYEVRREVVLHPRAPRLLALRLVAGLYWADLARVGTDPRLHPVVRRAADLKLIERLPGLASGEKMAVARAASANVIAALRLDPTPRVTGALLENPRLTEGLLMPLAASEKASPLVLARLAADPRWGVRPGIRNALCRNPATPLAAALAL